jgi:hypothetical protein
LNFALPSSIKVYEGSAVLEGGYPIKAWCADIDYSDKSLLARPFLSQAATGRELASAMAQKVGAYVAINGGYFDMAGSPARTFSLVKNSGQGLVPNITRVLRAGKPYYVTRSALGIRPNRTFDIAWIAHIGNDIYTFPAPIPNTVLAPAPLPSPAFPAGGSAWANVSDAIGGGPTLISQGQIRNTYEEEVFFGSGFSSDLPYPRAAVGYTRNNHLILFVVDGKQPLHSVGMTLPQVAEELRKLGCVEAMNLDGGGSATLVVNGLVINTPSDVFAVPVTAPDAVVENAASILPLAVRGKERPVTSILAIIPAPVQANRMSRE